MIAQAGFGGMDSRVLVLSLSLLPLSSQTLTRILSSPRSPLLLPPLPFPPPHTLALRAWVRGQGHLGTPSSWEYSEQPLRFGVGAREDVPPAQFYLEFRLRSQRSESMAHLLGLWLSSEWPLLGPPSSPLACPLSWSQVS